MFLYFWKLFFYFFIFDVTKCAAQLLYGPVLVVLCGPISDFIQFSKYFDSSGGLLSVCLSWVLALLLNRFTANFNVVFIHISTVPHFEFCRGSGCNNKVIEALVCRSEFVCCQIL